MLKIFGSETQQTISEWARASFGDVGSTRSILTRANCELAELVHAIECGAPTEKIASEIADVIIVLCRYPDDFEYVSPANRPLRLHLDSALWNLNGAMNTEHIGAQKRGVREVVDALVRIAELLGLNLSDAIDAKMAVNRGRTWVSKGAGHGQHVEAPPLDAFGEKVKAVDAIFRAVVIEDAMSPDQGVALLVAYGIPEEQARRVMCPDPTMRETLKLAAEYKTACGTIKFSLAVVDETSGPSEAREDALAAYHRAITRAGNARRALLAYVAGDTPEVAS